MNIDDVDFSEFKELIDELNSTGLKSYCIAGGCLRDTVYKRPITDIDIFYWKEVPEQVSQIIGELKCEHLEYHDSNILTHTGMWHGYTVDFILVVNDIDIYKLLRSFPASISQIALGCNKFVYKTPAFIETLATKRIYFAAACPTKYSSKISDKYKSPEFLYYINPPNIVKYPTPIIYANGDMFDIYDKVTTESQKMKPMMVEPLKYRVVNINSTEPVYKLA